MVPISRRINSHWLAPIRNISLIVTNLYSQWWFDPRQSGAHLVHAIWAERSAIEHIFIDTMYPWQQHRLTKLYDVDADRSVVSVVVSVSYQLCVFYRAKHVRNEYLWAPFSARSRARVVASATNLIMYAKPSARPVRPSQTAPAPLIRRVVQQLYRHILLNQNAYGTTPDGDGRCMSELCGI